MNLFGSDTTASTLTHIFYHLAQNPQHVDRLRLEICSRIDPSDGIVPMKLQDLDYLNGIINETLRLHPPVPTAIPRLTPPEGIQIADVHIPGDITVWCPPYATGRSTLLKVLMHLLK
jgi:cytochrome P450